jgi:hypothetical protein
MKLIILFGVLLLLFTIYWKFNDILYFSFVDTADNINKMWKKMVNDTWVYMKSNDGVLYLNYGKDHDTYKEFIRVKNPEQYIQSYL